METRYQAFVSQRTVNTAEASVQVAQLALMDYGAANLCMITIHDEDISFNSSCLRLLRVLFDGAPAAVQRKFEKQLNLTKDEMFVSSYKRTLQQAIPSFTTISRATQHGTYQRTLQTTKIIEAGEFIPVIEAVCSSSGHEIQDYLREQPGRPMRSDGITVIVDYLLVLTRYFPAAVAGYNLQGKQHSDIKQFGKLVVKQIAISLEALGSIVDGPNTCPGPPRGPSLLKRPPP